MDDVILHTDAAFNDDAVWALRRLSGIVNPNLTMYEGIRVTSSTALAYARSA